MVQFPTATGRLPALVVGKVVAFVVRVLAPEIDLVDDAAEQDGIHQAQTLDRMPDRAPFGFTRLDYE